MPETGSVTSRFPAPLNLGGIIGRFILTGLIPLLALLGVVGYIAYGAGKKSGEPSRELTEHNDRAAEIFSELVNPPADLKLDDYTVLSDKHRRQAHAWIAAHKKISQRSL